MKKLLPLSDKPKVNGYYFVLDELNEHLTLFRFLDGEWVFLSLGEWTIQRTYGEYLFWLDEQENEPEPLICTPCLLADHSDCIHRMSSADKNHAPFKMVNEDPITDGVYLLPMEDFVGWGEWKEGKWIRLPRMLWGQERDGYKPTWFKSVFSDKK